MNMEENKQAYTETQNYGTSENIAISEIRKPYHVLSFDEKTLKSVTSRDGKDLTRIGDKSNLIYFVIPSDKFDDFINNLKEGESLGAEAAIRNRLNGFLPQELFPDLEAIIGVLN